MNSLQSYMDTGTDTDNMCIDQLLNTLQPVVLFWKRQSTELLFSAWPEGQLLDNEDGHARHYPPGFWTTHPKIFKLRPPYRTTEKECAYHI